MVNQKGGKLILLPVVIVISASLLIGAYVVIAYLQSIFAPHTWFLYPPPAEHELIDIYFDQTGEARGAYLYSGTVQARKFEVRIDSFSDELTLIRNGEVIKAPYVCQERYRKVEGRPCGFGFQIVAPGKPGEYEVNIRFIISNSWLSYREYPQKLRIRVLPMPYKPKPEEILRITVDKRAYVQGETMIITIQNVSNETIWFTNAAYNLIFERFDGSVYVFHYGPISAQVMVALHPREVAQLKWVVDKPTFPPGRYRVGTHGVYAEFEVVAS